MAQNYDVIIIGAGPAGIFTALELLRKSCNPHKILLVEKGKPVEKRHCPKDKTGVCVNCKPTCAITTGFSGAGAFSDGKLSPGHARALLGFKDEQDIIETADLIIEKGLTVRDVEKLVKKRNKEPKAEKPAARRASYYDEVELALTDFLGRKVKVGTKPGKESGVLEIDFFDKDDLTRLADALKSLGD